MQTIAELGESKSLALGLVGLKPAANEIIGTGDDAAVVSTSNNQFLVSTDTLIENHDFRLDWSTGFDLGWKAVASNLADIAAMGGNPTSLVVAVAAPGSTTLDWLRDFVAGLQAACDTLAPGCGVVGGDLATADQMMISVTVMGELAISPVLRSGAQPGDNVVVIGTLGRAACGLALLEFPNKDFAKSYDEFVTLQLRPNPPISQGVIAAELGATAMLDVSDGLSTDAARISKASDVSIEIDSSALLGYQAVLELAGQSMDCDVLEFILHGGEDHSLLATFPPDIKLPGGFKKIGNVVSRREQNVYLDGKPLVASGWDSVTGS